MSSADKKNDHKPKSVIAMDFESGLIIAAIVAVLTWVLTKSPLSASLSQVGGYGSAVSQVVSPLAVGGLAALALFLFTQFGEDKWVRYQPYHSSDKKTPSSPPASSASADPSMYY